MAQRALNLAPYEGATIVVTGASGFIGSHLVSRLASIDCHIIGVRRSGAPDSRKQSRAVVSDVIGDIRHEMTLTPAIERADVVFHLAAQTSARHADADPAADFEQNVTPMHHLLGACRRLRRHPAIVFAGTATQCGLHESLHIDEDVPDRPITTYDRHKRAAEAALMCAAADGVVDGVSLRLTNVYGPGQRSTSNGRGVLNLAMRNAIDGRTLEVFGNGEFIRDYLFVDDAVEALLAAGIEHRALNGGYFVVGSGCGTSIRAAFDCVARCAALVTGRPVAVASVEPREPLAPIDTRSAVADSTRFARAAGWKADWTLEAGIRKTIEAMACE